MLNELAQQVDVFDPNAKRTQAPPHTPLDNFLQPTQLFDDDETEPMGSEETEGSQKLAEQIARHIRAQEKAEEGNENEKEELEDRRHKERLSFRDLLAIKDDVRYTENLDYAKYSQRYRNYSIDELIGVIRMRYGLDGENKTWYKRTLKRDGILQLLAKLDFNYGDMH